MKQWILRLLPIADLLLLPLVYPAAWLLKQVRRVGVRRLPLCRSAFMRVGLFPIRNHYYEPQFDHRAAKPEFSRDRVLPGIDWNVSEQLSMLERLTFAEELAGVGQQRTAALEFYFNNGSFESGDAEFWYQLIRAVKPRRIIEVGSGNSTLMAIRALRKNRDDDPDYECTHVCIEPYEMPWLESAGVSVLRSKVEDLSLSYFAELQRNDILFIDSSHIIRPQGDVVFEYLQLIPSLGAGVIVHIHDIFSPKNYLARWLHEEVRFWNEQYLLEAFLTHNAKWKVIAALNQLHHGHYDKLKSVAPFLTPEREPGSFYIQRVE